MKRRDFITSGLPLASSIGDTDGPMSEIAPRANAAACPQLAKADFAWSSQHVRECQRIAALDDLANEVVGAARGAGEHGDVRIRRKETCGAER
jgi:hypothetical protein